MEQTAAPEINKTKQKKKEKKKNDTDMSTADIRTVQTKVERNWDIESDDKQKNISESRRYVQEEY